MAVPPPEDVTNQYFCENVRLKTVLHVGGGLFGTENESVTNTALRFRCGNTNVLVDLWSAPLDVPEFTLLAYDTSAVVLALSNNDVHHNKTQRLADIALAVVSLDGGELVQEFARQRHLPLFQGKAGFFWCVHYLLTK